MGLLTPGYFPATYWAKDYWADDYWQDYGAVAATPFPLCITIANQAEYGITIANQAEYGITITYGGCT